VWRLLAPLVQAVAVGEGFPGAFHFMTFLMQMAITQRRMKLIR
jgi:hypothetical protein